MYKNQLKKIRIEKGMTLLELSNKSGVSIGYLCHLEKGSRKNPSLEIMDKIAVAIGKTISEIFFE